MVLSLVKNVNFSFDEVQGNELLIALGTVFLGSVGGISLAIYLSQKLFTAETGRFAHMSLKEVMSLESGYLGVDPELLAVERKERRGNYNFTTFRKNRY